MHLNSTMNSTNDFNGSYAKFLIIVGRGHNAENFSYITGESDELDSDIRRAGSIG